jgi:superfamily II DNA or RNA helicase
LQTRREYAGFVHRQQLSNSGSNAYLRFSVAGENHRATRRAQKLTGTLDVALIQSLVHKEVVDDRVGDYGHLIVDECHHLAPEALSWSPAEPKRSS